MGSRLHPAGILVLHCLLMLLGHVDSKANQNHSETDRQRHLRSHNLHRPPYEGYDWHKHFSRDAAVPKEKENEPSKPRSGHLKQKERTANNISTDINISTTDKHRLFQDILSAVKILKAVQKNGAVTENERHMLSPKLKPLILRFVRMFENEFVKNTKAFQALKILEEEVKKNDSKENKYKRSRQRHH